MSEFDIQILIMLTGIFLLGIVAGIAFGMLT